jgi:hypothetical protein
LARPPRLAAPYIADGRTHVGLTYGRNRHDRATIERLLSGFVEELYCLGMPEEEGSAVLADDLVE